MPAGRSPLHWISRPCGPTTSPWWATSSGRNCSSAHDLTLSLPWPWTTWPRATCGSSSTEGSHWPRRAKLTPTSRADRRSVGCSSSPDHNRGLGRPGVFEHEGDPLARTDAHPEDPVADLAEPELGRQGEHITGARR